MSARFEKRASPKTCAVKLVAQNAFERFQAVADAALEIDGRRLLEIARRGRDVTQAKAKGGGLNQKFAVENKIVGVSLPGNSLKHLARIGAQPGMPFAEILPHEKIFHDGQKAV